MRDRRQRRGEKLEREPLTPDERADRQSLLGQLAGFAAERVDGLSRFAYLRERSLPARMDELGIRPPDHG